MAKHTGEPDRHGLKLKNGPARRLQGFQARIKGGTLLVHLGDTHTQRTNLRNEPAVILDNMRNSISRRPPWSVELGGANDVGR